jgi:hypothetical protein
VITLAGRRQAGQALGRWLGLPAGRVGCLLHFAALAVTLAAAKVILNTIGVALFLAEEGPQQLPLFYVLLALVAIALSAAAGGVIDRVPRIALGQGVFLLLLLGVAVLRLPIALQLPAVYYAVLASAHIYEIALEIVFWVIVAAFLDTVELKRCTPLLYMALAAGGAAGGALTIVLSPFVRPEDLLLALPVLGLVAAAQLELARRRLEELEDRRDRPEDARPGLESLRRLSRVVARYPLSLLIALNALMLTVLYGLSEFLVYTVYAETFVDQAELTRFLALAFAAIQVIELAVLYAVSRPLLERAGPLARNLVFPLTSLLCLVSFAVSQKLPVALATHVNAEAISNAIFQPVNNVNYSALPLRFHGRARTLADGVFYSSGLALAGLMLLWVAERDATAEALYAALVCALLFLLVNVGIGLLYLPTLVRNLRSGVVHFADAANAGTPLEISAEQLRALLRQADPDARALGLDLAARFDPDLLLDELRALAPAADRPTRRRIAALLARASSPRLPGLLDELLESGVAASQLIALQCLLARADPAACARAAPLASAPDRSVAALAQLAAAPPGASAQSDTLAGILPWCRAAEVAADVVDGCGQARHAGAADLLIALIEVAPLEQQRQGLLVLAQIVSGADARAAALGRRLAQHPDLRLRTAAVGVLAAVAGAPGVLETLGAALGDRSRPLREQAVRALAAQGDAALPLIATRLRSGEPATVEAAIRTLGRIGSPRARGALAALLETAYAEAARNLDWLRQLPQGAERQHWRALELVLEDRNQRIVDLVLNVAAALGAARSLTDLRYALLTHDQRTRADALEALLASPQRRLLQPIVALLTALYDADRPAGGPPTGAADRARLLAAAARAADPWIRRGAAHTADRLAAAGAAPQPQGARAPFGADAGRFAEPAEAIAMEPADARRAAEPAEPIVLESVMERVLFLKRVPLFRHLPLDALLAVSRALEQRHYLAGETICEADARWDHFAIVERGAVELQGGPGGAERLRAPAYFGELVLADEAARAPRIAAAEDCSLLRLHRIVFHDLSRDHPEMLMELCKLLARRIHRIETRAPA